jgi:hypothetical protein
MRTDNSSVKISEEIIQQALAKGVTQEQIQQQENQSNSAAAATIGKYETCKFNASDLTVKLNQWKNGSFSTEDYNAAECWGTMFGAPVEGCNLSATYAAIMSKKLNVSVKASGFKGKPEDVSWAVENASIASINDTKGSSIRIKGENDGSTHVIVTDNAVGPDCKFSIQVQVS